MILWDKKPEIRKRWKEILSNPEDPLFLTTVADFLASSVAGRRAIARVGQDELLRNWKKIRPLMENRGATARRLLLWDEVVSKLTRSAIAPQGGATVPVRSKHQSDDEALSLFGREMNALRKSAGMTIDDLAEKVRSTPAIISRLERGLYNPSLKFLLRLSTVLGPAAAPVLFPRVKLSVRVEALPNGGLVLTDGGRAIQLVLADDVIASAKCGAEMFGHRFYMALAHFPEAGEIFDRLCGAVTDSGITLTEAFRIWFYQYQTLRSQSVKEEYLEELLFKAVHGWIAALSGRMGFFAADVTQAWENIRSNADEAPSPQLERFVEIATSDRKFPDEQAAHEALQAEGIGAAWLKRVKESAVTPEEWQTSVKEAGRLLKAVAEERIRVEA
jgi:transcriptional regulator with XRE-family HTH domain